MPGGDRTGPVGAGPITGRGAGFCAGYGMPGYMNPAFGRGYGFGGGRGWGFGRGFGAGMGRGWRHWYYATGSPGWARAGYGYPFWGTYAVPPAGTPESEAYPEGELEYLKAQAKYFNKAVSDINKRIDELQKKEKK
jgi:hypothetical protein